MLMALPAEAIKRTTVCVISLQVGYLIFEGIGNARKVTFYCLRFISHHTNASACG